MGHVFICHVTEDARRVKELRDALADRDVTVWKPDAVVPGLEYLPEIRRAIRESALFILCLSRSFLARETTVAYEELTSAVEQWRQRPPGRPWLVAVLLEECEVPAIEVGRGQSLRDLQWVPLYLDWEGGLTKLLEALQWGVQSPPAKKTVMDMRYRLGQVEARVLVDLLGGGDETFDWRNMHFEYQHDWVPLSPLISEWRDRWIEEEQEEAVQRGKELFNGPCVRLHSFRLNVGQADDGSEKKRPILSLRPTCWFDYVLSNKRLDYAISAPPLGVTTLRAECADEARLYSTRETAWVQLSNILTVSVVLLTTDGWTVVGRRTNRVDNASGVFQASAAENVHRWKDEPSDPSNLWSTPRDLTQPGAGREVDWTYEPKAAPNPFFTALRGLREEIAREMKEGAGVYDITCLALAWDWLGFNPHLYTIVRASLSSRDVQQMIDAARAQDSWEAVPTLIRFEPHGDLKHLLMTAPWAEVSKGAVLRALVAEFGYQEVARSLG